MGTLCLDVLDQAGQTGQSGGGWSLPRCWWLDDLLPKRLLLDESYADKALKLPANNLTHRLCRASATGMHVGDRALEVLANTDLIFGDDIFDTIATVPHRHRSMFGDAIGALIVARADRALPTYWATRLTSQEIGKLLPTAAVSRLFAGTVLRCRGVNKRTVALLPAPPPPAAARPEERQDELNPAARSEPVPDAGTGADATSVAVVEEHQAGGVAPNQQNPLHREVERPPETERGKAASVPEPAAEREAPPLPPIAAEVAALAKARSLAEPSVKLPREPAATQADAPDSLAQANLSIPSRSPSPSDPSVEPTTAAPDSVVRGRKDSVEAEPPNKCAFAGREHHAEEKERLARLALERWLEPVRFNDGSDPFEPRAPEQLFHCPTGAAGTVWPATPPSPPEPAAPAASPGEPVLIPPTFDPPFEPHSGSRSPFEGLGMMSENNPEMRQQRRYENRLIAQA